MSVVIPAYNMEKYIRAAVDSVFAQSFRDLEVVVVDDGSTDRTPEILATYGEGIRLIRQPNRGGAAALNAAIRASRGEWVAWLSADDVWTPMKLERQAEAIRKRPDVGLVYTDYMYIDSFGNVLSREPPHPLPSTRSKTLLKLIGRCFINGSSTLIRRDVFERIGYYDERDRLAPDWDMWFRIAAAYDLAYVPEPLTLYRIHGEQTSAKKDRMDRAQKRVATRAVRRMGPGLGSLATILLFKKQIRNFPAYVRKSIHGRTIGRQFRDLLEWLVLLVNPDSG